MSEAKTEQAIEWEDTGKPYQTAVVDGIRFTITDLCNDNFEVTKIGTNGDVKSLDGFISMENAKSFVSKHLDNIESGSIFYKMSKFQRSNREFMQGCGQVTRDTPGDPGIGTRLSQMKIIWEEIGELLVAMRIDVQDFGKYEEDLYVSLEPFDLTETADALADIIYTCLGMANACGIAMKPVLDEVCENNLLKLKTGTMNAEGKLVKHLEHPKPDIAGLLKTQGWEGGE